MRDSAGRRDRQAGHVRRVVAIGFVLYALSSMSADPSAQHQPTPPPVPAILQSYKPVTADRLKKPEDGDWLMARRTYDGWGYSPLDQITRGNVTPRHPGGAFP